MNAPTGTKQHNRQWSDPTFYSAARNVEIDRALPAALLEAVLAYAQSNPTARPRRIARSLGLARLVVEAAIDRLIELERLHDAEGRYV